MKYFISVLITQCCMGDWQMIVQVASASYFPVVAIEHRDIPLYKLV